MTTLMLTSPLMKSSKVRNAQRLLADNDYGVFYTGLEDGVFGEETARATYRAQYWLGYRKPNHYYGEHLRKFLLGKAKLSVPQRLRRRKRLKALKNTPLRVKAFKEAEKWIGSTETPPYSNIAKPFTPWYLQSSSWGTPWCAIFCSYVYMKAGSKAVKANKYWAYCPYILADARAGRNNLTITKTPKQGDWVLIDFGGDGVPDHIELFDEWSPEGGRVRFKTIGGNTSPTDRGSQSNGGMVCRKERRVQDVVGFVRVGL